MSVHINLKRPKKPFARLSLYMYNRYVYIPRRILREVLLLLLLPRVTPTTVFRSTKQNKTRVEYYYISILTYIVNKNYDRLKKQ